MINFFKRHSIFKDQQAVILMGIGTVMVLVLLIYSGLVIESRDLKVVVRFSDYTRTLSDKGEWFTLYIFPIFAVLAHFINSYLALKLHAIQRTLSVAVLSFNAVVLLFSIFVTIALLNLL
ncbi:MAG: hypothetical protein R3313_03225 [Candidatus Saccharimonadales bacterium]|nr:hypothetical protein [Candidatus Saccharimonadales bacterium]